MARSRNIKPSFFNNDLLAEVEPLGRIFFIGLWTVADFKGDLEWRPKKLKAQLLPYDNCDLENIAINLDQNGFIRFYSVQGRIYLNIVNFTKHQNPHKNEKTKGSEIPTHDEKGSQVIDFKEVMINRDKNGTNPDNNGTDRADSFNLIPDPLNPISNVVSSDELTTSQIKKPDKFKVELQDIFEYWKEAWCKNDQSKFTDKRKKAVRARLKEGYTVEQIKLAIYGCSVTPHNNGTEPKGDGRVYDCLELICRNGDNVERFAGNANRIGPPAQQKPSDAVSDALTNINDTDW